MRIVYLELLLRKLGFLERERFFVRERRGDLCDFRNPRLVR